MTYLIFTVFMCVSPLLGWSCKDTQHFTLTSYDDCMKLRAKLIQEYKVRSYTKITEAKCLTVE